MGSIHKITPRQQDILQVISDYQTASMSQIHAALPASVSIPSLTRELVLPFPDKEYPEITE